MVCGGVVSDALEKWKIRKYKGWVTVDLVILWVR